MYKYSEIKKIIQDLLSLLEKYDTEVIKYQVEQLKLVSEILNSDIDINEKNNILAEVKDRLYPLRGGLTDFYVWKEDGNERAQINKPIDELIDNLWRLLK